MKLLPAIGNHDLGLDHTQSKSPVKAFEVVTSANARECGIYHLGREVKVVAQYRSKDHGLLPVASMGILHSLIS